MLQRRRVAIATITSIAGLIAILISIVLSVILGYADIKLQAIWDALFHFDPANREHLVIQTIRLPRVFAAGIVGTCFAVAGAMMQGMTRNPLADSSLLGINAGAGLVLALTFAYLTHVSYNYILLLSVFGATVGAALIYGIGVAGKNNSSSLRLVLAGAAVTALFNGLNEGLSLYFGIGQKLSFWYATGVSRVTWSQIVYVTPWFVAGLVCALVLSRSVTILSIGEDNARSLGLKIGQLKLVIAVVVLVLAGISVALVGGVGFVGLIVPHLVRKLVGHDYRLVIPCSAVLGALLVILADLFARTMNPPFEIPLSAVTAALGVPFFLYLVRKGGRMER